MRATGIGNLRISPPARAEHPSGGGHPAQHGTSGRPATPDDTALPVPLAPSPARDVERIARARPSAAFLAQVIAQARPGVSPARQARRRPAPALDAYRTARALKVDDPIGRRLDLAGI